MRDSAVQEQNGIALISAMLIAAIVTAGAVALSTNQFFNTRRVTNTLGADRARLAINELELSAISALKRDSKLGRYDGSNESWANEEFKSGQGDVSAKGALRDLQGLFNLTNLSPDPAYQTIGDAEVSPPTSEAVAEPLPPECESTGSCTTTPEGDSSDPQLRASSRAATADAEPPELNP
ncbi:MAG: hypothetical protein EXR86_06825 [Gammaproteobacteria bacterium]|nr:hypothetical protein [Gammaproteobacteria bacterium]